jgi:energy-converting hydrogenase Eha subunit H
MKGALWNLLSSVLYGIYAIALNVVASGDGFDYGLFLGFIGLINIIILVPFMIILHYWGF